MTTPSPQSPASPRERRVTETTRVPMSVPNQKLAVPPIPGFFLYWHLGKNVPTALRAGYSFVEEDEVDIEQHGVANSAETSGSTDMGTRVSISAGPNSFDDDLQPSRLYLMKLPQAWRDQDVVNMGRVNEKVATALRSGMLGAEQDLDKARRYMKQGQDLFFPKAPRA